MAIVKYENIKLKETTKSGKLKQDENGYYDVILGALNTFNSRGEYYRLEGAEKIFTGSSTYHRLISQGKLYGEHGHPKPAGMSRPEYLQRIRQIHEETTGTFIKEVTLDDTLYKRFPTMVSKGAVIIMGKVLPYGAKKDIVADGLANPDINFAYSVRAFTDNYRHQGTTIKVLSELITWDSVGAQGINVAEKYCAPSLESQSELVTVDDMVSANALLREQAGLSMEDQGIGDYSDLIIHAGEPGELEEALIERPNWTRWTR